MLKLRQKTFRTEAEWLVTRRQKITDVKFSARHIRIGGAGRVTNGPDAIRPAGGAAVFAAEGIFLRQDPEPAHADGLPPRGERFSRLVRTDEDRVAADHAQDGGEYLDQLREQPHIHCVVPGGGLSQHGDRRRPHPAGILSSAPQDEPTP